MRLYWSLKSVPELSDLSAADRRRVSRAAWRESGGMSHAEIAFLGLAVALGANFGPLGIGLCVALIMLPILLRKVERLRPAMLAIRHRLGFGLPRARSDF